MALGARHAGKEGTNVEGAAKTFGKIEQENMPEIDRLLGNMVMTGVEFCSVEGKSQKIYGYSNTF